MLAPRTTRDPNAADAVRRLVAVVVDVGAMQELHKDYPVDALLRPRSPLSVEEAAAEAVREDRLPHQHQHQHPHRQQQHRQGQP